MYLYLCKFACVGYGILWAAVISLGEAENHLAVKSRPRTVYFEYREDLSRKIGLVRGDRIYRGQLDSSGNFIQDEKCGWIRHPFPPYGRIGRDWPQEWEVHEYYAGLTVINDAANDVRLQNKAKVYEYRSGRLILGSFDVQGNFIPETHSQVITLKEYLDTYDPEKSPRIYNLPGRIVVVVQDANK